MRAKQSSSKAKITDALHRPEVVDREKARVSQAERDVDRVKLTVALSELGFRPRTLDMLGSVGIVTAADLVRFSEAELRTNSFGNRTIADIVDTLGVHALSLAVDRASATTENLELAQPTPEAENELRMPPDVPALEVNGSTEDVNRDASVSGIAEADLQLLEQAFSGIDLRSHSPAKKATLTDVKRAENYAARRGAAAEHRIERLRRDDERVSTLRETITLTVDDVAYLYAVSRDTIYDALNRPNCQIPHKRVGRRFVIPTRLVFKELGLE